MFGLISIRSPRIIPYVVRLWRSLSGRRLDYYRRVGGFPIRFARSRRGILLFKGVPSVPIYLSGIVLAFI